MTDTPPFDDLLGVLAGEDEVEATLLTMENDWETYATDCRNLFRAYLLGSDLSERTERALYYITHLLASAHDQASFPTFCQLARQPDRLDSVLGEEGSVLSYPPMLLSTFDGDPAPLFDLILDPQADELARGDGLLVAAYLARTGQMPERSLYVFLQTAPAGLQPAAEEHFVWFGWARAVAAMGFAGLSGEVESAFQRGLISDDLMNSDEFWQDLRDAQQNPNDVSGPIWGGLGPMDDAGEYLDAIAAMAAGDPEPSAPIAEPIRNPLRNVGRNDPCPCGSGKKFKKCCLLAS